MTYEEYKNNKNERSNKTKKIFAISPAGSTPDSVNVRGFNVVGTICEDVP